MSEQPETPEEIQAWIRTLPPPPEGWKIGEPATPWGMTLVDDLDSEMIWVKWDGCSHYWHTHNGMSVTEAKDGDADLDYTHLCEFEEWLERMMAVCRWMREIGVYRD